MCMGYVVKIHELKMELNYVSFIPMFQIFRSEVNGATSISLYLVPKDVGIQGNFRFLTIID